MSDTRTRLQPWRTDLGLRITGTPRHTDPFLGAATEVRDALAYTAWHLLRAGWTGRMAPVTEKMVDRVTHPRPGDLVYIPDSLRRRAPDGHRRKGFGYLIVARWEWWHTDAEWQQSIADGEWGADDDRPTDKAYYLQYGPNPFDVCRWVDCECRLIPHLPTSADDWSTL